MFLDIDVLFSVNYFKVWVAIPASFLSIEVMVKY